MQKSQAERIARLIAKHYPPLKAEVIRRLRDGEFAVRVKNPEGWIQIVYGPFRRDRVPLTKMVPQRRKKARR